MKTKFLFAVLFSALLFTGCSNETLDPAPGADGFINDRGPERPFKVNSAGTFAVGAPDDCAPLVQINLEGSGNGTHLGNFDVSIVWCDDFAGTTIQNGIVTAANGDQLYFTAVGFGTDEDGDFGEYDFDGGTGRFADSYGFLKLYNTVEFTGQGVGNYSNQGEGFIVY